MGAMRVVRFLVGVAVLASVSPAIATETSGRQAANHPPPVTLLQPAAKAKANVYPSPYRNLFAVPALDAAKRKLPTLESVGDLDKPTVVCGMKLMPVDPAIDPKIYLEPRRGGPRYSIRALPPPVCK